MTPLQTIRRRMLLFTVGLLVFLVICWFLFPYRSQTGGLIVGITVSLYNFYYLSRKVRQKGEYTLAKAVRHLSGSGMVHRFLMVALAIIVAILYPQWIDVHTVILGIPLCYILVVLVEGYSLYRQRTSSGKE